MRTIFIGEDEALMESRVDCDYPIECWHDVNRICDTRCAAFRIESHLDGTSGTSIDADFVHCVTLGDRGLAIGRIDGN
jgi:hypothetical protein